MLVSADGYGLVLRDRGGPEQARGRRARRPRAPGADREHRRDRHRHLRRASTTRCASSPSSAAGLASTLLPLGMRLAAAGTHPFSLAEDQRITRRDRYRHLVEQLQYVARRELVFGMHIHVAVPDPDTCMKVMEGVLIELPILLALSSNSPFWRGEVTGLASTRTAVFAGFPRSGLPAALRQLRRLRRDRRLARGDRRDRRLHAPLVGRSAAPAARHARGARDGRAVRPRVRDGADGLRAGARRRADRRDRGRATRPSRSIDCWSPRTSGSPRATGSRRR